MSVIFNRAFSTIPADRVDKLQKGELAMVSDGVICSLVLRVENDVFEFKSKKVSAAVLASSSSGGKLSVAGTDSPVTLPSNHSHLTILCDLVNGSIVLNLPSVIDLPVTSFDIKRISKSFVKNFNKKLTIVASTTRLSSGDKQLIDESESIRVKRKHLSVSLKSTDTGWSIV